MRPLCIDLFCGLGGWAEGFLSEGYDVIGFDIERHDYGTGGYPGQLVLQDALTIDGARFKDAAVIVASPPCQKYSYMAMPWSKAKELIRYYEASAERREELNALFNACFRIQREAEAAAGHHIPLIVENVRGAQRWVGRAKANYGSYYLWGDVGMVGNRVVAGPALRYGQGISPMRSRKTPIGSWDLTRKNYNGDHSWATKNESVGGGSWFAVSATNKVLNANPDGRKGVPHRTAGHWTNQAEHEGFHPDLCDNCGFAKQIGHLCSTDGHKGVGIGSKSWAQGAGQRHPNDPRNTWSKSSARKAASAQIAKIPFPLAQYIARSFKPILTSISESAGTQDFRDTTK